MDKNIQEIVLKLRSFLKDDSFPLHEPQFNQDDQDFVVDCIKAGWVSSVGKYVDQFERDLEAYTGVKCAVVVMNGTAALHMCYLASGVRKGDEVLCPALTFVATANAITYCGAIPHFVEVEGDTLGVCPTKLKAYLLRIGRSENGHLLNKETGQRISTLVITHVFGHPAQSRSLRDVCDEFSITLIEDAAEALGSFDHDVHVGNFGICAALSFNGNKIITTGGGGAILTNDEALGAKLKHITTTAKVSHAWEYTHDHIGYNYRMPNINAALGCAQLAKIEDFIETKKKITQRYVNLFQDDHRCTVMTEPQGTRSNYWLNALILKRRDPETLNHLLQETHRHKIYTRPTWIPLHRLSFFQHCSRMDLSLTEEMSERILNLPSSVGILNATH